MGEKGIMGSLLKLTDWLACTDEKEGETLRWGRGTPHDTMGNGSIGGYLCRSAHLPYLMDPFHERYGVKARLWRSEAADPHRAGRVRVRATRWTTREEVDRPSWVGSSADLRVRLRFGLLACLRSTPPSQDRALLEEVRLGDLNAAAERLAPLGTRRFADLSPPLAWVFRAVLSAALADGGRRGPIQTVGRLYPCAAWWVASAADQAGGDLDATADEAVRREAAPGAPSGCSRLAPSAGTSRLPS